MAITYQDHAPQYVGAVLEDRERNYYDDSDFYAVVWTGEKLKEVEYNSTRFASGGSCSVDATPETWKAVGDFCRKRLVDMIYGDVEADAAKVEKGKMVTVAKGRKVPIGTVGKLFWIGETRTYGGYSRWSQRQSNKVGIARSEEKDTQGRYKDVTWTYLQNLEVAEPAMYLKKTKQQVAEAVAKFSDREAYSRYRGYVGRMIARAMGNIYI